MFLLNNGHSFIDFIWIWHKPSIWKQQVESDNQVNQKFGGPFPSKWAFYEIVRVMNCK